jgi:hypothetical protein
MILFSVFAQASLRETGFDREPRILCRRAEMNACIENHKSAGRAELDAIAGIDGKLQLLARDGEALSRSALSLNEEARSATVSGEMAKREIGSASDSPPAGGIFPDGPSAEEIFFLRGPSNSWGELHPGERRARLNTLAESSEGRVAELKQLQRNLAMEIDALASSQTNLQQERAQRAQQVNVHVGMCEYDCKMRFCPQE